MLFERSIYPKVIETIKNKPVTVITGARRVGKTTLCSLLEKDLGFAYVSLADPLIRNFAKNDPNEFLSLHPAPLIIDEIQKAPELFDYLEGIVDASIKKGNKHGLYVLTGSQSYHLMKGISESMSGRVGLISMEPLSLSEINGKEELPFQLDIDRIQQRCNGYKIESNRLYEYIVRGFYPELYDNPFYNSASFFADYVSSYLERDVSDFIGLKDKEKFVDMMTLLASLTSQELIYDNLAKQIGVDKKTIQSWINVLVAGNIIYFLHPYHENSVSKRVIKRSKVYFADTGLACYLARVNTPDTLYSSYLKGAMFETFVINEIMKSYKNNLKQKETSFYYVRTFDKQEIDLIILNDGKLTLIECKAGTSYNLKDFEKFKLLKDSRYALMGNVVICTTPYIYKVGQDGYVLPFTSI